MRTVVDLLRYAPQRNLPSGELAALVKPLADRLEERVPSARFIEALEVAVRATGDEDFIPRPRAIAFETAASAPDAP
ncbi:hypothetical protein [Sorangium sp. So ce887]|uniref:hypothetical protein n=1 Tax=Sorangium sp. So ce887 TaxID=3133324 RepID=UPI003F607B4F